MKKYNEFSAIYAIQMILNLFNDVLVLVNVYVVSVMNFVGALFGNRVSKNCAD